MDQLLRDELEGYALSPDYYGERAVTVRCFPTPNGRRIKLGDVTDDEIGEACELFCDAPDFPESMSYVVRRRAAIAHPTPNESHVRTMLLLDGPPLDSRDRPPPIYAWRDYGSPLSLLRAFYRSDEGEIIKGELFLEIIGDEHVYH